MKKILCSILYFLCFLTISCTPGLFFLIENCTGDIIELDYSICDDLLNFGIEKTNQNLLRNNESIFINFSLPNFFNRGVAQKDYLSAEIFLSIFESIIAKYNDDPQAEIDLSQSIIKHEKKRKSDFYILMIIDHAQ
jgi:hypothetical protein